jgi:uncharacterized phage protein gp47/JayE
MSSGTGFGVTPQGFVCPQLTDILPGINQTLKTTFGAGINTKPNSFFGQIAGIFGERELLVWQAMQDVYNSQNPNGAFGASLDNVGALRGVPREGPFPSTVANVRLFGIAGTPIPGTTTQFSVDGSPTSVFFLNSPVVLAAGQSCIQLITFSTVPTAGTWTITLGGFTTAALAFNATAAQVQAAIQGLLFASGCTVTGNYAIGFTVTFNGAGTGGFMIQPQFVATSSLTNAVPAAVIITAAIITPGIDQASVPVTSTADGPIIANSGTLTVIITPVAGLTAVLNTQDAVVGQLVESDNAYRLRMEQALQSAGAGTVEAIRSKLLEITGVTSALVFENVADIPDLNGRPPHSFECVVQGGTPEQIAEAIWLAKPAGIETFGNANYVIIDSQGLEHTIYYSRPYPVPVYMIANLTVSALYPSNGDVLVQEALVNYVNSLGTGVELIVTPQLVAQLAPIPGIQTAQILVGIAPDPLTSDNITPTAYQILTADTANCEVNS